ncbi:hypothetical protein HALA3H3_200076 [Halomonas sp. A3H3]|nr:hypothetical protein HALA3H3_200076 [Halomonas sp. A3H3]
MPESGLLELRAKGGTCAYLCSMISITFFNITVTRPDHESDGPIYAACCTRRC